MIENRSWTKVSSRVAMCAVVAVSLAACGGGQTQPDSSASLDSGGATPTPTPTPTPSPTPTPTPTPTNTAPALDGDPPLLAKAGAAYLFAPAASDSDNDALSFTATGLPVWATFNEANGSISGTPGDTHVGTTEEIEIVVSDGTDTDSIGPFRIQVAPRDVPNAPTPPQNRAPSISGNPAKVVRAGTPYIFVPTASDPDGDTLLFAIAGRPSWATFNTSNGQLSGTPSRTQTATTSNIRISVTDGKTTVALGRFSIQITPPPNTPPVVSGAPSSSATVGTAYSFVPGVSDAENDRITWSIQNRPSWATFNTTTGRLSGTPTSAATSSNIRITASDGFDSTAMPTFSITVSGAANRSPSITGNPPTSAPAGTPYSFKPNATDPDADTSLTYSIENQPSWADFSRTTGTLSGTPDAGEAGAYAGIIIRVTDGSATASLPSFTITVTAPASPPVTGSASLDWTPPTTNVDGTQIQNLAGYRIYYGNSASTLDRVVTISTPGITSYVIENLRAGAWFFAVTSFTDDGTESANSSVVTKTIQ